MRGEHQELLVAESAVPERLHLPHERLGGNETVMACAGSVSEATFESDRPCRTAQLELHVCRRGSDVAFRQPAVADQRLIEPHQASHASAAAILILAVEDRHLESAIVLQLGSPHTRARIVGRVGRKAEGDGEENQQKAFHGVLLRRGSSTK